MSQVETNSVEKNGSVLVNVLTNYISIIESKLESLKLTDELKSLKVTLDRLQAIRAKNYNLMCDGDYPYIRPEDWNAWKSYRRLIDVHKLLFPEGDSPLNKAQSKELSTIYNEACKRAHADMVIREERVKKANTKEASDLAEYNLYKGILEQIESNLVITSNDYEMIMNAIKDLGSRYMLEGEQSGISEETELDAVVELTNYLFDNDKRNVIDPGKIVDLDEEVDELEENVDSLDDTVLTSIFSGFGYKYSIVNEDNKMLLSRYGNKSNMINIFEALKPYKIADSNINSLSYILVYSNPEIVKEVLSTAKIDAATAHLDNVDTVRYINRLVCNPKLFIQGKKAILNTKGGNSKLDNNSEEYIYTSGAFTHYKANRQFLIDHGVTVADMTEKYNKRSFFLSESHRRVLKMYECYKSYGFTDERLFKTVSCFTKGRPYPNMDFLIENGYKEHLYRYLVASIGNIDDDIKYRILLAKKCGVDVMKDDYRFIKYISIKADKSLYYMNGVNVPEEDVPTFLGIVDPLSEDIVDKDTVKAFDAATDKVIYDPQDKMHDFPYFTYLEENYASEDGLVYNLGIVNISSRKVVRVYSALKKEFPNMEDKILLLYAMTKDSILNQEQVNAVKTTIDEVIRKCGASYERRN